MEDIPKSHTANQQFNQLVNNTKERRRRLFPRVLITGLFCGLIAVAFQGALHGAEEVRDILLRWSQNISYFGWLLPVVFCAFGGFIGVYLVKQYCPEASGSGIPHVKAVLLGFRTIRCFRMIFVKFIGGVFTIGAGMALGREGPTVQMGGAMGQVVANLFKSTNRERQNLISAGAGAGLAAAFNAPLAGILFVIEELHGKITPNTFFSAFIACITADIITRSTLGQRSYFAIPFFETAPLQFIPHFIVLGCLAGLVGVLFTKLLVAGLDFFQSKKWKPGVSGAIVAGVIGVMAYFMPYIVGGGHKVTGELLNGTLPLGLIPAYFVIRFVMTIFSYGTGAPGGIFAPLLVLGGLVGLGYGSSLEWINGGIDYHPALFAAIGMGALLIAVVRAPLTGIVLIIEMTGSYSLILPLLAASAAAFAVVEFMGIKPVYEILLERDLLLNGK